MEMLLQGALIGLSVAVPRGPKAAVCMGRTLTAGRRVGFRCGLGAASARACYPALAVPGVGRASHALSRGAVHLHMAGGLVLLMLALRLGRSGAPAPRARGGGAHLTTLAVGLTNPLTIVYFTAAIAPGTIPAGAGPLVMAGVGLHSDNVSETSRKRPTRTLGLSSPPSPRRDSTKGTTCPARRAPSPPFFTAAMATGAIPAGTGPMMVVGVFVGSAVWWVALTSVTAAVRHHLTERRFGWANRLTVSAIGGCGVMTVATAL